LFEKKIVLTLSIKSKTMRNKKILGFIVYIIIQAPILFVLNMYGHLYPLKQNIIMSIIVSFLSALLFHPMNRLILFLKNKFFVKNTSSK